jgi:hypothetical protein
MYKIYFHLPLFSNIFDELDMIQFFYFNFGQILKLLGLNEVKVKFLVCNDAPVLIEIVFKFF